MNHSAVSYFYAQTRSDSAAFAGDAAARFGRAEALVGPSIGSLRSEGVHDGLSGMCFDLLTAPAGILGEDFFHSVAPVGEYYVSRLRSGAPFGHSDQGQSGPGAAVGAHGRRFIQSSAPLGPFGGACGPTAAHDRKGYDGPRGQQAPQGISRQLPDRESIIPNLLFP